MNIQSSPSHHNTSSFHHHENINNYEDDWSDDEWNSKSNSVNGMELRNLIPKNQQSNNSLPKSKSTSSSYSGYTIREDNWMER